ncbi:MAG TPA: hypothetical protein VMZ25_02030 [Terriglobales bacterium]|nr:hypothetical protein [Terriglobales bacterium]
MKRLFVTLLVVATLLAMSVAAQTSATSQTTGSATQKTSATAGKTGAGATSATGATASQTTTAAQGATAKTAASATSQTAGAITVPAGTKIPAVLSKSVDSKKAKVGDHVEARTVADIVSQGKVVIPKNSKLLGHITESKAKAGGEAESRLGIVFDQIAMRKGQTIPLNANIQAIGAAVVNNAMTAGSTGMESTGSSSGGASGSGGASTSGGGVLGGATGAVGSTVGGATGTVGGVADTAGSTVGGVGAGVGSTVDSATQGTVSAAGNNVGLQGTLNSNSTGVVGLKDLQLSSSNDANAGASVVTSSGKSVKLDGGSQLMLNVTGSPKQ